MSGETWRPIPGFSDYEVSDSGLVRSYRCRWGRRPTPKVLAPWVTKQGYRQLTLQADAGGMTKMFVHSAVLLAFVGPRPDDLPVTRHLNGDPTDNRLSNLVYGTYSENQIDKVRHGTHHYSKRTHCANGHPFAGENLRIDVRKNRRVCRTCETNNRLRRPARLSGVAA